MNLLPTKSSYTTPWHCSVAFRTDGTVVSRPKVEFEDDPTFALVWENGRPSHFRELEEGVAADDATDSEDSQTALPGQ